MLAETLLGYAAGIITIMAFSRSPEVFKITITNPEVYVLAGFVISGVALALALIGGVL